MRRSLLCMRSLSNRDLPNRVLFVPLRAPKFPSPGQGLLRSLPLSRLHNNSPSARPANSKALASSNTSPNIRVPITPNRSDFPWQQRLGHSLQGSLGGEHHKRGLLNIILEPTTTGYLRDHALRHFQPRTQSAANRIPDTFRQGGHRNSRGQVVSRFLFAALPCTHAKSTVEASNRLEPPQQLYTNPQVQDGHPSENPSVLKERTMGVQLGPQGCVFSDTHPSNLQKISAVGVLEHSVPVQNTSFRDQHRSLAVHQGGGVVKMTGWEKPKPGKKLLADPNC